MIISSFFYTISEWCGNGKDGECDSMSEIGIGKHVADESLKWINDVIEDDEIFPKDFGILKKK